MQRTETILVRFTPQERAEVDAAAEDKGITLGVWLRNLALKAVGYKVKKPEPKRE
ncbi:MAG TPA: hypothetical protein VM165_08990 [Planctomycetaceae bacterium]|nr:hypothetical protein [Planctomycetaceae bacterium]